MDKKIISSKQAICILIMFLWGNTLMISGKAKQDSWIALIIALFLSAPFMMVYARIVSLYPGQNLYDVILDVFGKLFGKIIVFLYVLYAIQLGASLMRFFSEFMQVVVIPETPQLVVLLFLFIFSVWMVRSGEETLGRWSKFVLPLVVLSIVITLLISIRSFDLDNIKPVAGTEFSVLIGSSFTIFASPFAETILFTVFFSSIKSTSSPYKIYIWGVLIATIYSLMAVLRNILVMGFPSLNMYYFASYSVISVISVGDFFSRFEVLIGLALLLDVFVKLCVCMFAATKGISKLININNDKNLAVPVGLLMITLASILYSNTAEMFEGLNTYKYYALPFQVILPLIILAGAEIKTRLRKFEAASH